jgi:protein-S-isoprenylcysteine O-methyltransferase Ste14
MHYLIDYKPPRIAMGLIVLAAVTNAAAPLRLHASLPFAAALAALLGFTLMIRAWWLFKQADTAICPTAAATSLITHDVFSVTRNPMYVGILIMLLALGMLIGAAAFYAAAIIYFVLMDRFFCVFEEQKSRAEFGDEFVAYTRRVRRWL